MLGFGGCLPLLAVGAGLLAQVNARIPPSAKTPKRGVITNSYIVEFAIAQTNSAADGIGVGVGIGQDGFLDAVQSLVNLDIGINVGVHLDYKLFKGFSCSFTDDQTAAKGLAQLASHQNIKRIWPNAIVPRPQSLRRVADGADLGTDMYPTRSQYEGDLANMPHVMTQVDKLHAKGIFGNGTRVCIVDGGVDYTLGVLGGGFGAGHVISFGKDLVGDGFNALVDEPKPDDDPISLCDIHGNAVTGVVAAQPENPYGIIGVAPGASIGVYRAYSCDEDYGTTQEILVQAMYEAYEGGCQVISGSFSNPTGWTEGILSDAAVRITAAGVACVFSHPNDGVAGMFYSGSPSGGAGATSVGSVDNLVTPDIGLVANFTVDNGPLQSFKWARGKPAAWAGVTLPLWAPDYNDTTQADRSGDCSKVIPDDAPDLSGYVVLLPWRNCDFAIEAKAAADHGAKYIIQYNNQPYQKPGASAGHVAGILAAASVRSTQGNAWLEALAAGSTVTVHMADPDTLTDVLTFEDTPANGGLTSPFSSWGPTYELDAKPEFLAPGGNILAVWSRNHTFRDLSGTSFAAPYIAGVYALIAQARGTHDPAVIQSLLSATADPLPFSNSLQTFPEYRAPVFQQGAGNIRALDAAYATVLLSRSSISFNDTDHLEPTTNFTIKNLGTELVTFALGHATAPTVYTLPGDKGRPQFLSKMELTAEAAAIAFASGSQVTVAAGGEATVSLTVTPPALDPQRLPMYSGWITLNGTNGENLSLPYTGCAGSMMSLQIFSDVRLSSWNTTLDGVHDSDSYPAITGTDSTFTVPYNESEAQDNVTYPYIYIELAFGTAHIDVHLVSWNSTKDVAPGTDLGSIEDGPDQYYGQYNPDDPAALPYWDIFDGTMNDGSYVPEGTYYFKASALKIFGDVNNPDDYEYQSSPPFTIKYTYDNVTVSTP